MECKEYIEIIKNKSENRIEIWNSWRERNPSIMLDFREKNLNGLDMGSAYFYEERNNGNLVNPLPFEEDFEEGRKFIRRSYAMADLHKADFRRAKLRKSNLSKAILYRANFQEADITESDFYDTILYEANLYNANLARMNLKRASISKADIRKANLREADLRYADLSKADLRESDITGVKLYSTGREDWIIEGVKCDYIFRDELGEERYPEKRNLRPGEFEELYKNTSLTGENFITRSIEFPPEYHQAGISILNEFGSVLRKKYPDTKAKIRIEQDGLKVTMRIDPVEGSQEVIEKELDKYGLVIMGEMTPEEYAGNDPLMLIELRSQLNIAKLQLENQKLIVDYQNREIRKQDMQIESLFSLVGQAVQSKVDVNIMGLTQAGQIATQEQRY